jgi:para-nitrobenzyl esterase
MLDDPAARAVLERLIPEIIKNVRINMARGVTLEALQAYLPDQLSDARLKEIDSALAQVPGPKK